MDKRFYASIFFLVFLLLALTGCGVTAYELDEHGQPFVADGMMEGQSARPVGDDAPVSRALSAKMIALAFAAPDAIDAAPRIINFDDTAPEDWFDIYINKAYALGYLSGMGASFYPDQPLTLEQAQLMLNRLDESGAIRITLTDENRHMNISYALWVSLFMQMLENTGGLAQRGLAQQDVIVLITPEFNETLPPGNIVTDAGRFSVAGLDFEYYLDKQISILARGNRVLAVTAVVDAAPTIQNAFIVGIREEGIS
ncbi:MAG: S-layer homology domain-containing protein, partial [Defluviitaleaceae bacterium]|nr:S-layer homology domain-containing protein [Defluviitaleaceae bacterium]